jgi:hypothetical protein
MQTGNGFGNPTASAPTMTPPPGYESRIPAAPVLPVEPLLDDPYPSAGGERELTDDIARDVYPGSSGGVSGV